MLQKEIAYPKLPFQQTIVKLILIKNGLLLYLQFRVNGELAHLVER